MAVLTQKLVECQHNVIGHDAFEHLHRNLEDSIVCQCGDGPVKAGVKFGVGIGAGPWFRLWREVLLHKRYAQLLAGIARSSDRQEFFRNLPDFEQFPIRSSRSLEEESCGSTEIRWIH